MFCTAIGLQLLPLLLQDGTISSLFYPALVALVLIVAGLVWLSRRFANRGLTVLLCLVIFFGIAGAGAWLEYQCELAGSGLAAADAGSDATLRGYLAVLGPAVFALAAAAIGIVVGTVVPARRVPRLTGR